MLSDSPTRTLHRSKLVIDPLPVILKSNASQVRLDEGTCLVGSGSASNLLLDDPTVSRAHAEFSLVPEGVHVRDLGSRNGTFYQGQRLTSAILSPGTRILLGGAPLSIELDEAHLAHAASLGGSLFRGMSGASAVMLRLFTTISRLDGSLVSVLVRGETGVGKELVARAIHEGSRVSTGPFVPVNCAMLSRELVASTLFGHARGAFTGAVSARQGAFLSAHEGTLFLDEVSELPLDAQASLLRALETGEILPLGQDRARSVRVRVLAATNRDLVECVRAGVFREDLYFRLAVVTVVVPPLRERREDIPDLARSFARQEGASDLDDEVIAELKLRDFPGNVRELRNAVLAYLALGQLNLAPATREAADESRTPRLDVPYLTQRDALVEAFTREYLIKLLEHAKGNQVQAARLAGLDRTYLGRMVSKLGLSRSGRPRQ
jgi:DNA-binding NtrC family response regulator